MSTEDQNRRSEPDARSEREEGGLEEYERGDNRPPFILNMAELKLLGIAGVGFFLDGKYSILNLLTSLIN